MIKYDVKIYYKENKNITSYNENNNEEIKIKSSYNFNFDLFSINNIKIEGLEIIKYLSHINRQNNLQTTVYKDCKKNGFSKNYN
jgi:hypothetical protein